MDMKVHLDCSAGNLVEANARIVAFDREGAWLEPEPGTSCGSCASAAACGAKGLGSQASRLEGRRFRLAVPADLAIGDRVVVGMPEKALVKAAFTAYGLPLAGLLTAGILGQSVGLEQPLVLAASLGGLGGGLMLARLIAARLTRHGDTAPRFLRRADAGIAPLQRRPSP
jgi:sigma-E factor negative regulatory protein RseC